MSTLFASKFQNFVNFLKLLLISIYSESLNLDLEKEINSCYVHDIGLIDSDCLDTDELRKNHTPPSSLCSNDDRLKPVTRVRKKLKLKKVQSSVKNKKRDQITGSLYCHLCSNLQDGSNILICTNENCQEVFCKNCIKKLAKRINREWFNILQRTNEDKG